MTPEITSLRKQIDDVDDKLIEFLCKRIELSNLVIKSKPPDQILDLDREQAIHQRFSDKLLDLSTPQKLKRLVSGILATSRFYPEP